MTRLKRALLRARWARWQGKGAVARIDVEDLDALLAVVDAARPFGSGWEWGKIKAWMMGGAPDRSDAMNLARTLTGLQVALDAALAALDEEVS